MLETIKGEERTGLILLFIFLFICLIFVIAYTGFNPFRDCDTFTNSTRIIDCWFNH